MEDLLESYTTLRDEVKHFEAYDRGYYAILRRGPRLDILRVFNFQPEIEDFDDYPTYMFIQAVQGFFILRQDVRQGRVEPWFVHAELVPKDPASFFDRARERPTLLCDFARRCVPPPADKKHISPQS